MGEPRLNQWYGWVPDLPDRRDLRYSVPMRVAAALPPKADLTPNCSPVFDQSEIGSCTANAIAAAHMFEEMKQGETPALVPSRLFIYYNERETEGTVDSDSGAQIRDGIKSVATQGVCDETLWPYDITQYRTTPPPACYQQALKHEALTYYSVNQNLADMKGCLAAGYPFVFGFSVYEGFESEEVAKTGTLQMPGPSERQLGGHACLCVGYDDSTSRFTVQNSWGTDWGQHGFFTIPYAYLADNNLADDFWTIRMVM